MKSTRIIFAIALVMLLTTANAMASGFGFYEHGAKATALAGAFVARADDASAIYYNPAGLAFLEGKYNLYGAMHPVKPDSSATFANITTDTTTGWQPPFAGYIAMRITDSIKAGFGVFVPYGLEVKWPVDWLGSAISQRTFMSTYFFRPAIAIKVSDNMSFGVGVDFAWSKLTLAQQSDFSISPLLPSGRSDAEVEGTGSGVGFTVGALIKVNEQFQIGAKYQHEIEIDYEGDVVFDYSASGHPLVDGTAAALLTGQNVTTTITMPSEFVVGAMYRVTPKMILEADYQFTTWSSFESLDVAFDNPLLNINDESNWEDSWMIRIGLEYWVADEWAVRGGYIFDTTPIPDDTLKPILPDSDRNEITLGLGYDTKESCCWGALTADFALQWVMGEERDSTFPQFPATYTSDAFIVGFGIGVSF